ncbi:MAG TPA: transcriptional repressor [Verrucomicrobiae bacterium]|jgi:Fur family ferric uptake transcriptional regulator|nr:transcriptional repressor [Verrucomicrobiae bacterium]
MSSPGKQAAKEKFLTFLEGKKLRMTAQRQAIIETVFNTEEHFTAEQLLVWARERDPSVSRATVYRTLPLLTESGLVREMDFGKESKFYDPNYADHPNHNHIICSHCDKIVEFESSRIAEIESEISHKLGFSVRSQRLQITGECEQMKKSGTCKNRMCR